jgi:hypothetical protein
VQLRIHLDLQPLQTELTERVLAHQPERAPRRIGVLHRPDHQADARRGPAYFDRAGRCAVLDVEGDHLRILAQQSQGQVTIGQRRYGGHAVNATR